MQLWCFPTWLKHSASRLIPSAAQEESIWHSESNLCTVAVVKGSTAICIGKIRCCPGCSSLSCEIELSAASWDDGVVGIPLRAGAAESLHQKSLKIV